MSTVSLKYSREQLLKIRDSVVKSDQYNWKAIDNIIHPSNNQNPQARLIPSLVPSVYSARQEKNNRVTRPYLPHRTAVNTNNLIEIPTYSSITEIKRKLSPPDKSSHGEQRYNMGSRGAHNAHLVDPGLHDYMLGLDPRAHNALGREPAVWQEEAVDAERHMIGRTSEVPASSEKLVSPDTGSETRKTPPHHNLIRISTSQTKPSARNYHPGIILTNCQSITMDKLDELRLIMEEKTPQIVMLTESWLTKDKEQASHIDDYTLHTSNRSGRVGGGVAIYTHNSLDAKIVKKYTTTTASSLWIKVCGRTVSTIYGCIYSPKCKSKNHEANILEHISETITTLSTKHTNRLVIGGDFNHLNMKDISGIFDLHNIVDFPTRGKAFLDHVYTNIDELKTVKCQKLAPLGQSDHDTIFVPGKPITKSATDYYYTRKITPAARIHIQQEVAEINWATITQQPDVHQQAADLQQKLAAIVNKHCPKIRKKAIHKTTPWFDSLAKKLKNAKKKAYSKGCPSAKIFGRLLKNHIRKSKKKWICSKLQEKEPKSLWTVINCLRKTKNKPNAHKSGYVMRGEYLNNSDMAEKLNTYFSTIGGEPTHTSIPEVKSDALQVTPGQVKAWLMNIDTKKATCSNDFPSWVSRMCAEDLCVPLTDVFNNCFKSGIYPDIWKQAEIVPLQKCNVIESESDFRPISLLWHLGKILEKAMMFFYVGLVLHDIDPCQFAYQKGKSTIDAITTAMDHWTKLLDEPNSRYVTVAFLDMSKAFDKMDRGQLADMLLQRKVDGSLIRIIQSFLHNRYQSVRLSLSKSTIMPAKNGAPQGTIMGPMLWLLYIDSLATPSHMIKYADDLTLTAEVTKSNGPENELQSAVDAVSTWCNQHNMTANAKKSCAMNLRNKRSRLNLESCEPELVLNQEMIPVQQSTKFLGIVIDKQLSFEPHIDYLMTKVRPLTYILLNMKRSGIPHNVLQKFYTTCIRPRITYGSQAWYHMLTQEQKARIIGIEKLAAKIITSSLDSYHERLEELQLLPIEEYIENQCISYMNKIQQPNHCLHHLLPGTTEQRRSRRHTERYSIKNRTTLRSNSFIAKFANYHTINYALL